MLIHRTVEGNVWESINILKAVSDGHLKLSEDSVGLYIKLLVFENSTLLLGKQRVTTQKF